MTRRTDCSDRRNTIGFEPFLAVIARWRPTVVGTPKLALLRLDEGALLADKAEAECS
jgi:hypothetical protein